MGNASTTLSDVKITQKNLQQFSSLKRKQRINLNDDTRGSQRIDDQRQRLSETNKQQSNSVEYGIDNYALTRKSQSLDTVLESQARIKANNLKGEKNEIKTEIRKLLIPRIKLTRTRNKIKSGNAFPVMSTKPDSPEHWQKKFNQDKVNTRDAEDIKEQFGIISNDKIYNEMSKNTDENYFTKNFDECMKRIQMLEKEHEMMEKNGTDSVIPFYYLNEETKSDLQSRTSDEVDKSDLSVHSSQNKEFEEGERSEIKLNLEKQSQEKSTEKDGEDQKTADSERTKLKNESFDQKTLDKNQEIISKWYSNLKQQFERMEENNKLEKSREKRSCRITGATLKNSNENFKAQDEDDYDDRGTRHYFSRLVKPNKTLIDEELPDPDLVKSIRAKFQENLNASLSNNQFGGSLQNISSGKVVQQVWRPLSAQCNRDDLLREIQAKGRVGQFATETTDSVKGTDADKEVPNQVGKTRLVKKQEKEFKMSKDSRNSRLFPTKWTDTGSVSSGVSSDLSSYDTDLDSFSKDGIEPEADDTLISDDDLLHDVKDRHYVQNEILEKIRSFGTSVTYYGGEMITCSVGPLLSPTAAAIMEEINEKYGYELNISKSFAEFYRKYDEVNESNKKKKIGRARSFGQNDVFQKPNTLNNTEIELYKFDLEMEIGIRKPKGLLQNNVKPNTGKYNSGGRREESGKSDKSTKDDAVAPYDAEEMNSNTSKTATASPPPPSSPFGTITEDSTNGNSSIKIEPELKAKCESEQQIESSERIPLERSQSAPHEITNGKITDEDVSQPIRLVSRQLLFGYDKNVVNGSKIPDIHFEEYEVSESPDEKLQKCQAENLPSCQEPCPTELTSSPSSSSPSAEVTEINNKENHNNTTAGNERVESSNANENSINAVDNLKSDVRNPKEVDSANSAVCSLADAQTGNENKCNETNRKFKVKNMRWPLETRGVVDLEKGSGPQFPLVKDVNEKPKVKRKIRLF